MSEVVRRWLRVYGPGSHEELALWWGISPGRARKPLEALCATSSSRSASRVGRPFALADDVAALEGATADGRARLLPGFDPHVVGFFPREGLVEPEFKARVSRTAGWISPVVLVGGKAVGVWSHKLRKGTMEIAIEPFRKRRLGRGERRRGPLALGRRRRSRGERRRALLTPPRASGRARPRAPRRVRRPTRAEVAPQP